MLIRAMDEKQCRKENKGGSSEAADRGADCHFRVVRKGLRKILEISKKRKF